MVKRVVAFNNEKPQERDSFLDNQSHKVARVLETWRLKFETIAMTKCGGSSLEHARQNASQVLPMLKLRWQSHEDDKVSCADVLKQLRTRADVVELIILSINVAHNAVTTHGLFSTDAEARLYMMGRVMDYYHVPCRL